LQTFVPGHSKSFSHSPHPWEVIAEMRTVARQHDRNRMLRR